MQMFVSMFHKYYSIELNIKINNIHVCCWGVLCIILIRMPGKINHERLELSG